MDCEGRSLLLSLYSENQDLPFRRPRLKPLEKENPMLGSRFWLK